MTITTPRRMSLHERHRDLLRTCMLRVPVLLTCLSLAAGVLHAQSSGPVQLEFSVPSGGSGPSVNPFTGGFSFGIPVITVPGPDGSSYSVSLSYQSGMSPELGASWVGYGWSLNAGAIIRDVKGFPDDWKGNVRVWNKMPDQWTASSTVRAGIEADSKEFGPTLAAGLAYSQTTIFNSDNGYRRLNGYGIDAKGFGELNFGFVDGENSFGGSVNPTCLLTLTNLTSSGRRSFGTLSMAEQMIARGASGFLTGVATRSIATNLSDGRDDGSRGLQSPRWTGHSTDFGVGYHAPIGGLLPGTTVIGPDFGGQGNLTVKTPIPVYSVHGIGYGYSSAATASDLMDYSVERSAAYREGDPLLPIPFNSADNFSVTGGAPGGGLRLHLRNAPVFRPDYVHNVMDILHSHEEVTLGPTRWGFGLTLGPSYHSLTVGAWDDADVNNGFHSPENLSSTDGAFFRYDGEMGGNVIAANDDVPAASIIDAGHKPVIPASVLSQLDSGRVDKRSNYIGYVLNADLLHRTDSGVYYAAYDRQPLLMDHEYIDRSDTSIADQIGQLSVTDGGGTRYNYGLPVYSRGERRLAFSVADTITHSPSRLKSRHIVYAGVDTADARRCIGQVRETPYAPAYLLTSVTSPDYVDLTGDGPSADDIGGWVKFTYDRTAGLQSKSDASKSPYWFHWRAPYNGLYYAENELSDPNDDMGSMTDGEREQYYLHSIETKTHVALFVLNRPGNPDLAMPTPGSGAERLDGYQAPYTLHGVIDDDYQHVAAGDSTATYAHWVPDGGDTIPYRNFSRRLERIELYTKNAAGNPDSLLSTTFFEYDYSLRPGMINSNTPKADTNARVGMLTLKRMWTQGQRVYNARIAPYEFGYEYRHASNYPAWVREKYPEIVHFADSLSSTEQNPSYSAHDLDRWGSYASDEATRLSQRHVWNSQHPDTTQFDPAAWQLKTVHMPTGGELQVQYEQNDYGYVQDRPAMAMVSLLPTFGGASSQDGDEHGDYYLNLADIGIADTDGAAVLRYRALAQKHFVDGSNRVYLQFLYALVGDTAKFGDPAWNSDNIIAFAHVDSVALDTATIDGHLRYAVRVMLGDGKYKVPKLMCHDFVKWRKRGRLSPWTPVSPYMTSLTIMWDLMRKYPEAGYVEADHCQAVDFAHSYLRVPVPAGKKGAGIRVRRLLTFDSGIEGDSALYGTEYLYQAYDTLRGMNSTSGVAANEPSIGGDENALFNADLADRDPKYAVKIIAHDNLERFGGPIGQALLPSPSVGYSRVITRNIHTGVTNPGFSIQEFFTTREYPSSHLDSNVGATVDHTPIVRESDPSTPLWGALSGALNATSVLLGNTILGGGLDKTDNDLRLTQGYRFIQNRMNGAARSSAAYGGQFSDTSTWLLTGLTQYEYFGLGEQLPLLTRIGDTIRTGYLGKETDVTIDSRAVEDYTIDVQVSGDVTVPFPTTATPTPDPRITASTFVSIRSDQLHTHVISKVISYPAIVKRVLTFGDGLYHTSENVAFDAASGSPIITRTHDSYNGDTLEYATSGQIGLYHSYAFPAAVQFPLLGQKAYNQRAVIRSTGGVTIAKDTSSGVTKLIFTPDFSAATYDALALLQPGDMIHLTGAGDTVDRGFYHVASISGRTVALYPVNTLFAGHNTQIDTVDVTVIESGRANAIGGAIAGITTYGETPTAVRNASNFGLSQPADFIDRRRLADTLNAVLHRGGGLIPLAVTGTMGAIFHGVSDGHDTCVTMTDTLWLAVRPGMVVLVRGGIVAHDSIVGSTGSPHPLVTHLNHYLDTLWGFHIDSSLAYTSQCDSTTYQYRHYTAPVAGYRALLDSFAVPHFDAVNYLSNYWIGDLVRTGPGMDTLFEGFRTGTNAWYSAAGMIDLHGVLMAHTIRERLWVSDCDSGGHVAETSLRHAHTLVGSTVDATYPFSNYTRLQVEGQFPHSASLGFFKEDSMGYLVYKNLIGTAVGDYRAYGIRFVLGDTTVPRLVCADTLLHVDPAGAFIVDDDGSLRYRPRPDMAAGPVPCLELCVPTEPRYRKHTKVIAASASMLDDSMTIIPATYANIPASADAYERGARGRWHTTRSFAYRTDVTGGAMVSTGERNYRDAGVFKSFRLFNWDHPELNDSVAWLKSGIATRYTPTGAALESVTPLGIYSAARLGYNNMQPVIAGTNARWESIGFASFEDDTLGDGVARGTAHAGRYAMNLDSNRTYATGLTFNADAQVRLKGLLFRFWLRTENDLPETGTSPITFIVRTASDSTVVQRDIMRADKVARTGEWTLYSFEQSGFYTDDTVQLHLVIKRQWTAGFADASIHLDDIKFQPTDAIASCTVYDGRTYRVVAVFDDDHFGAYPQYNAEGGSHRTIVETARGFKTVGDAYAHVPLVSRSDTAGHIAMRRGGGGAMRSMRPSTVSPSGVNGKYELLNVEAGADGVKTKVLGVDPSKLTAPKIALPKGSTPNVDVPKIDASKLDPSTLDPTLAKLPAVLSPEQRALVDTLRSLNDERAKLTEQRAAATTDDARRTADEALHALEARREAVLRQLKEAGGLAP